MLFKKAASPATPDKDKGKEKEKEKKESRIVRYFKEVRAEIRKVVWPARKTATNLTLIVLGVTATMSAALGLIDWLFAKLFTLIIG
jgi:preprotein translocase subunit SecE